MAGAKLRVKQLVEAAINRNLVETPVKNIVCEKNFLCEMKNLYCS